MNLSIVVPTTNQTDRVKAFRQQLLRGLARQQSQQPLHVELMLVLHDHSHTEFLLQECRDVLGQTNTNITYEIRTAVHQGKIPDKCHAVIDQLQSDIMLILDDDIEFESDDVIEKCLSILQSNQDTAAVCPYVYEPRGGSWLHNFISVAFYNTFRLWSVEDERFQVYNPYGKGYIDFADKSDTRVIHGCHWLPSPSLFVRKHLLKTRLEMMARDFRTNFTAHDGNPWVSANLWSVDMYMTYPLFLSGYNLTMMMDLRAKHWGYENSTAGYGFVKRITNETLWGYYYYRMFFHKNAFTFLTKFVYPNIGRLFHYISVPLFKKKSFPLMVESIVAYFRSYFVLWKEAKYVNWAEVKKIHQLIVTESHKTTSPILLNYQTENIIN